MDNGLLGGEVGRSAIRRLAVGTFGNNRIDRRGTAVARSWSRKTRHRWRNFDR